jgi:hypothetical protein
MKTQKIKIEIQADVPAGEYCTRYLSNEECELQGTDFDEAHNKIYRCQHFDDERGEPYCDAFHKLIKDNGCQRHFKCQQCMDACKEQE